MINLIFISVSADVGGMDEEASENPGENTGKYYLACLD